jgi:uncharacterized protein (DUF934 family)
MAKLIKHGEIVADEWKVFTLPAGEAPEAAKLPAGNVLVPPAVWQARKLDLVHRAWDQGLLLGVWLAPHEDPSDIADDLADFSVIGIHFPTASEGRGYSQATLLRTRLGYKGELRAFGDVGRDQLFFLERVGFDAISVKDVLGAVGSLRDFSITYQATANEPLPLFRRGGAKEAA